MPPPKRLDVISEIEVHVLQYRAESEVRKLPAEAFYKINTAAKMRGLKPHTLRSWVDRGDVPTLIMDNVRYVLLADIDRYVKRRGRSAEFDPQDSTD